MENKKLVAIVKTLATSHYPTQFEWQRRIIALWSEDLQRWQLIFNHRGVEYPLCPVFGAVNRDADRTVIQVSSNLATNFSPMVGKALRDGTRNTHEIDAIILLQLIAIFTGQETQNYCIISDVWQNRTHESEWEDAFNDSAVSFNKSPEYQWLN
jgi:hypothetical protein